MSGIMDKSAIPLSSAPEADRLAALAALHILDTPAEREFDALAEIARAALGAASAAVSLVDDRRQWFKARSGILFAETLRDIAFCPHAMETETVLVIPDAVQDPRFRTNPLVIQPGGIRFYAGAPLVLADGHCVGTLCVFDPAPRTGLTDAEATTLRQLADLTVELIEARRLRRVADIAARVIEATPDAVVASDADGRIVFWNASASRLFGRTADQALGRPFDTLFDCASTSDAAETHANPDASDPSPTEGVARRADGSTCLVELSRAVWPGIGGRPGLVALVRDISDRRALEQDRESARTLLDNIVTHLPAMLFVKDAATRQYVLVNAAGERVMGRTAPEVIGRTDRELFPNHGADYERRDMEAVEAGGRSVFESAFLRDDGVTARLRTTRVLIDGPDRPDQYILGVTEDMTPARTAEAEALRRSLYDDLTGLLNRAQAGERLHRMVAAGAPFAMLSIDLGRFHTVNAQWGEAAGDSVLVEAAGRLRRLLGPADWIARVGADEFAIMVIQGDLEARATQMAEAAIAAMSEPFGLPTGVAHLGAAVGLVLSPRDGATAEALRENVDLALHRAKSAPETGGVCVFSTELDAAARDRRTLEADLRTAVAAGEVGLYYQPLVCARTGRITSAEALARWTHPTRGPIRPDIFISLAEECGLIDRLGEQLLERACKEAVTWPESVRVAVNLSPLQFSSNRLIEIVRDALAVSGLSPDRLQLEVTEGLVIRDVERTFRQLEALRALGIQVLIDDFGVGYSSLSYFQRFRFDKVKIDKSFVDEVLTSRPAKAIISAVVGLGQALEMGVVAEGVETAAQMDVLAQMGCTHLQGYLFSPPLPPAAFADLLRLGQTATAQPIALAG